MQPGTLKAAVDFGRRQACLFVATADTRGEPHLAACGEIRLEGPDAVAVREWYCPQTVENLAGNPLVSIVLWDAAADVGSQLTKVIPHLDEEEDGTPPEAPAAA